MKLLWLLLVGGVGTAAAFLSPSSMASRPTSRALTSSSRCAATSPHDDEDKPSLSRRAVLGTFTQTLGLLGLVQLTTVQASEAAQRKLEYMPGLEGKDYGKPRSVYPDFTLTDSGFQYKDVRVGKGNSPEKGDRVVIDWEGYTIGYYGRIFEGKGKIKGGAFEGDKEFYRFVLGKDKIIQALEEGVSTMKPGGIRQIVVPPELGYPVDDPDHVRVGPAPSTFSGRRSLNFVLENQGLVDKTLLINVELVRVDKPGERGFKG